MDINRLERISDTCWRVPPREGMHVPAVIFADEGLIRDMDEKVCEQASNVARLPGIVAASFAMPDAHWGYGFPIGGVAPPSTRRKAAWSRPEGWASTSHAGSVPCARV